MMDTLPAENHPPDILLADDDLEDQGILCDSIRELYPQIRIEVFSNGATLLKYLQDYALSRLPRCIVIEYKMHDFSGPEILQAIGFLPRFTSVPKVVRATIAFEKEIAECLSLGASRLVIKPNTYADQKQFIQSLYSDFIEASSAEPGKETGEVSA